MGGNETTGKKDENWKIGEDEKRVGGEKVQWRIEKMISLQRRRIRME